MLALIMNLLSDVPFVTFRINTLEILSRVVKINEILHIIPISNFTVNRLPYTPIIDEDIIVYLLIL